MRAITLPHTILQEPPEKAPVMSGQGGLMKYDAMCRAIEAAHQVDEVKDIRDKAVAFEHYARQALNTDAERRACEIRLRAERKAGQLLAKMPKANGAREPGTKRGTTQSTDTTASTLADLGITRDQSSQWQKLGAMPQRDFELAIGTETMPTTKGILRSVVGEKARIEPNAEKALWLWGRLLDFERDGVLDGSPATLLKHMTEPMLDEVHRLAPRVAAWLKLIRKAAS